ncbi:hypothetical protein [Streptomyces sp. DvalAA-19]|uniref:hypothetical protein n=1 Tax=Streptomyces sp. DvalAA-19 TaxID=1839761 RepID=UPI001EFA88E7|nr:hypothetical protein [Streptomyces sp. DvalAA-19]
MQGEVVQGDQVLLGEAGDLLAPLLDERRTRLAVVEVADARHGDVGEVLVDDVHLRDLAGERREDVPGASDQFDVLGEEVAADVLPRVFEDVLVQIREAHRPRLEDLHGGQDVQAGPGADGAELRGEEAHPGKGLERGHGDAGDPVRSRIVRLRKVGVIRQPDLHGWPDPFCLSDLEELARGHNQFRGVGT